jgi:hypothetical protein
MSMRPKGNVLGVLVGMFRARRPRIYEVPRGALIPPSLVLLHEHSDHFSLQPAERMPLTSLEAALTAFLSQPGVVAHPSKDAFYTAHPEMAPEVVGCDDAV